jgi:cytochrome d ubiquinol oxidase subunit II
VASPTALQILWFGVIGLLWVYYFFLEGFDFGVGMLLPFLARDDIERRMVIRSIGPVWDGNEVWLIFAGGAIFAAFPLWYATLFSGFYIPLLLILLGLIVRGVAFEVRNQREDPSWRHRWDWLTFTGSLLPAVLWGVAFADIVQGVPLNAAHQVTGTLLDLLNPYGLLGGLTFGLLFLLHGATYLCLKLTGPLGERAHTVATRLAWPVTVVVLAFLTYTFVNALTAGNSGVVPGPIPLAAISLVGVSAVLLQARYHGWAFICTGGAIALLVVTIFLNLYPRVLASSTNTAYSLTITNSSASQYSLTLITIFTAIFLPVVVLYQAWTYWVFRERVTHEQFELPKILQKKTLPEQPHSAPDDA